MEESVERTRQSVFWPGLGGWNLYFLLKLFLFSFDWINFHVLPNAIFAAALVLPLRYRALLFLRQMIAIPIAVMLLYYDTWFPPIKRLFARADILDFSIEYLFELAARLVNWELLGICFVIFVAYCYLSQFIRFTTLTILSLTGLLVAPQLSLHNPFQRVDYRFATPAVASTDEAAPQAPALDDPEEVVVDDRPVNEQLEQRLAQFYQSEATRRVEFTEPAADAQAFDVLFLHICSLAWSDVRASGLDDHPLWQRMEIRFDDFNSVSTYSGPATLRLIRASCGQTPQQNLYESSQEDCYLFKNLAEIGFHTDAVLNHTGEFENFTELLESQPTKPEILIPTQLQPALKAFDASPIWNDLEVLRFWKAQRQRQEAARVATHYNTISLHDGNRQSIENGGTQAAPFQSRAKALLDDLQRFLDELEQSGRPTMVVFLPEHGAAIEGDRMQIVGLREIPTRSITHVPVGVYFLGGRHEPQPTHHIEAPSSYLALAELISRVVQSDVFGHPNTDWSSLLADLPQTEAIAENEGSIFMFHHDTAYVRMGEHNWTAYPQ